MQIEVETIATRGQLKASLAIPLTLNGRQETMDAHVWCGLQSHFDNLIWISWLPVILMAQEELRQQVCWVDPAPVVQNYLLL